MDGNRTISRYLTIRLYKHQKLGDCFSLPIIPVSISALVSFMVKRPISNKKNDL
jgi:hypothetical protein